MKNDLCWRVVKPPLFRDGHLHNYRWQMYFLAWIQGDLRLKINLRSLKNIILDGYKYNSMVNILVPTDFSALSKVAVQYAIKIANTLNGNITLLHVITITEPVRVSMNDKMKVLQKDLI